MFEHIEDDLSVIKLLFKINKMENFIFCSCVSMFISQHDILVGHYKRYAKKDLIEKCSSAGLKF